MVKAFFGAIIDYFKRTDKLFWVMTILASFYGFFLIASQQRGGPVDYLKTQMIAVFIGYIAAVILSLVDYNYLAKFWWFFAGIALAMTFAVFFIGIQVNGTDDVGWIRLPGGITFQPAELTKICFILTFSKHLAELSERGRLKTFLGVISLGLHAMIPVGLIHLQGDDGTALVFALMFLIMSFAAGVQLRYFLVLGIGALAAMPFVWAKLLNSDQKNRLAVLLGADDATFKTYGWQQYQGKVSIASGGVTGRGLFQGPRVANDVVPYQENDFIFTVAGEELGFIGCAAILLLFALILFRLLMNASQAGNALGRNICYGFFSLIAIQVLVNLGMVLGFLPVVGIPLPFFSSGGTSVACLYLGAGLVQSVYMHPEAPGEKPIKVSLSKTIQGNIFAP